MMEEIDEKDGSDLWTVVARSGADAVIDDAGYVKEVMNNGNISFDQALMALLIAELRGLNINVGP